MNIFRILPLGLLLLGISFSASADHEVCLINNSDHTMRVNIGGGIHYSGANVGDNNNCVKIIPGSST